MKRKSGFLKYAVCLAVITFLSGIAQAEEEKGFVVKMWERFKAKKAPAEVTPAAQKAPVIHEPAKEERPPVAPKPASPRPAVTAVPTTEAAPVKKPAASLVKKEAVKPVVSAETTAAARKMAPVEPATPRSVVAPAPAPVVEPRKRSAFSFVEKDVAKPAVSAEVTTAAQNVTGQVQQGAEPVAAQPEKNEVTVVETNYADADMEWVPEEVPPEGEETTVGENGEKKPKRPKISKAQMAETIERRLKVYSQILFMIPELQMKKSESGQEEYYYMSDGGIALKLKDLDEKTLRELFNRVNNEATRMNTERLHLQLLQQQQLMRTLQQMPQPPQQPPQPPQVFAPPPQPPQPPQPPRVFNPPPPPPQPPRRQ